PEVSALARRLIDSHYNDLAPTHKWGEWAVIPDLWTGDYIQFDPNTVPVLEGDAPDPQMQRPDRSASLSRRPKVRDASPDEDDKDPGAWMIQTAEPLEHAEDPMGMQRPVDKDEQKAPEEFADSLSDLPEARLVSTPQPAPEVLIS